MAPDSQAQTEEMEKNFTSLSFRSRRDGGPDNELISLGNRYAEQPENADILPTTSCRVLFNRALRIATGRASDDDIEFFMRYIKKLRNGNGGQLAGGQG